MQFININEVSKNILLSLKGIGAILAERIIAARTLHSIQDFLRIRGIGLKTLTNIEFSN